MHARLLVGESGQAGFQQFLGVGHLARGQIGTGLGLMVVWWLVLGAFAFFGLLSLGHGLACAGPVWFVVPILSALALANRSH